MLEMINTVSYTRLGHFCFLLKLKWALELRIHDEIERGDNDTVKMPNGSTVVIDGKTCAER